MTAPVPIGPVEVPTAEDVVEVPFFTNRSVRTDRRSRSFYADGRGEPTWGRCVVELVDQVPGRVNARVLGVAPGGQDDALRALASDRVVLYVHGYNIGFEKGCRRAARLRSNLGIDRRLLLFSWPADGSYLNYLRDLTDLDWSAEDLEGVLMTLVRKFGGENVDLIGHSMGALGLVHALSRLPDAAVFRTLTLAAPDMDREVFVREIRRISDRVTRLTVYVSDTDRALALARRAHGYPRAGQAVPGLSYHGADLVEVSGTGDRGLSGHVYHLYNEAVIEDLRHVLGLADGPRRFERVLTSDAYRLRRVAAGTDG